VKAGMGRVLLLLSSSSAPDRVGVRMRKAGGELGCWGGFLGLFRAGFLGGWEGKLESGCV